MRNCEDYVIFYTYFHLKHGLEVNFVSQLSQQQELIYTYFFLHRKATGISHTALRIGYLMPSVCPTLQFDDK